MKPLLLLLLLAAAPLSAQTLVEIGTPADGIRVELRYQTADHFFKTAFYPPGARALLRPATAEKLRRAQAELQKLGLGLKVWDAYRPLSVQHAMWRALPDDRYVADPAKGGRHNRGAAVDVTLVDTDGKELPMPTGHDDFSEKANARFNLLPPEVFKNRQTLQEVMTRCGFVIFETEWWHFDDADWTRYEALDLPLEKAASAAPSAPR